LGTEESRPCFWMDHAFGPGAQAALKGRGGLRARILTSGRLVVRNRERGEGRAVGMSSRSSVEALGDKTSPNSHADERSSSLASIIDSCRPAPDLGPHG
jgi:MOSC domain-containing protein YiiM